MWQSTYFEKMFCCFRVKIDAPSLCFASRPGAFIRRNTVDMSSLRAPYDKMARTKTNTQKTSVAMPGLFHITHKNNKIGVIIVFLLPNLAISPRVCL